MSFAAIGSTLRANTTFGNGITLWGEGGKRVSPDLRLVDCGVDGNSTAPAVDGEAREIERRYRTLVEQLPLVIYVDALDEASSNIFTSGQIEPLLGYTVEEWRDDPDLFVRTLHPDDRDRVLAAHARTHRTHEPLSLEYRLIARDGSVVWVRDDGCVVLDDDGAPLYLQGYVLDITAERELQEQLRRQALFDPLTGLANRAFFHEQLEHAVSIRRENDLTTAVVFVDLDEFKQINDQHGHSVGDEVLAILGERLKGVIRSGDSVARLGGDEFAVLLTSVAEPAEAAVVAERLLEQINASIDVAGRHLSLTASVGIAFGSSGAELLKQADAAMYRAKANGDADYAFYDDELDQAALNRFKRIAELREAITEKQFTLAYQPVVNLEPFEVVGLEALLRWQHPTLGEIPPLDFIPLAEESGLIVQIGRSVLIEACLYASRLREQLGRDLEMAVNVSARQLQHPEFVDHVDSALERADLPAHLLTLELTESVLVASGERAEHQLALLERTAASNSRSTTSARATHRSPTCSGCRWTSSRSTAASPPRSTAACPTSRSSKGSSASARRSVFNSLPKGSSGTPSRDRAQPRLPRRAGLPFRPARTGAQRRRRRSRPTPRTSRSYDSLTARVYQTLPWPT